MIKILKAAQNSMKTVCRQKDKIFTNRIIIVNSNYKNNHSSRISWFKRLKALKNFKGRCKICKIIIILSNSK